MCSLVHTTLGAHKQIILPTFLAFLSPHWHVFEKGAPSFGAAAGQKQTYWSIPVYNFLNFCSAIPKRRAFKLLSQNMPMHRGGRKSEKW
jgi:hypothetical protein